MENFNNQQIPQYSGGNQSQPPHYPPPYPQAYPPPIPPELAEEKRFKKWMYKIFGGNLLYDGIMFGGIIAITLITMVLVVMLDILKKEDLSNGLTESFEKSDAGSTVAVLIAVFFLGLFMRKIVKPREIFEKHKSMNPKSFIMILCIFYGGQLIFTLFDTGLEALLNLIGFSAQEAVEAASGGSESISMLIYAGFTAPIFEEVVFRGYMMKAFDKTGAGKGYAMLISSILFGVMHGNIVQSPFAFVVGMVLAYTAMEYGIIWSIILHFINNFIMSEGLGFVLGKFPENIADIVEISILAVFTVAGIIALVLNRKDTKAYIKENYRTEKKYYKWTLTNPLFIIFCVFYFLFSFTTITKLD